MRDRAISTEDLARFRRDLDVEQDRKRRVDAMRMKGHKRKTAARTEVKESAEILRSPKSDERAASEGRRPILEAAPGEFTFARVRTGASGS